MLWTLKAIVYDVASNGFAEKRVVLDGHQGRMFCNDRPIAPAVLVMCWERINAAHLDSIRCILSVFGDDKIVQTSTGFDDFCPIFEGTVELAAENYSGG
jgi:hypothetical protein